jgi:hypothetical protein
MITVLSTAAALGVLPLADELSPVHPADAVLYLEVPDVPGALAAYEATAYARLVNDPDVQAAIARVLHQESFDPWEALMDLIAQAEEEGDLPPLRELLAPTSRVAISLNVRGGDALAFVARVKELEGQAADDAAYERAVAEDLGLQLTVDFASAAAAGDLVDFLRTTLQDQGLELERSTLALGGHDADLWSVPEGLGALADSVRLVRSGARVVGLIGCLDTAGLQERAARTSAGGGRFAAGRKRFDPPSGVTLFELENRVSDQLMALAPNPAVSPLLDLAEGLMGPNLTMLTRGGHWRIQLRDGRFVTEGLHPVPAHSPLDGLFASEPLSAGALSMIHPEAIVAWAVHFDKQKALALLAQATQDAQGDPFAEIELAYGFRPDRDLIEPLGPAITYSLPGEISLLSAPPLMVTLALSDAAAFRRGIAGLMRLIEDEGLDEMTLSARPYRGYDVYTLAFEYDLGLEGLPIDPLAILRPSLVVLDDRVLITTNPTHAKKEIRRVLKLDGELHPWLASGAIPEGAAEVGFADWIQVVGRLYAGAKSMAPMLGAMAGEELPIDLTQLPEAELFTRHFAPSSRWKRHTEHGLLHWAESSFGPEAQLVLVAAGVGVVVALD